MSHQAKFNCLEYTMERWNKNQDEKHRIQHFPFQRTVIILILTMLLLCSPYTISSPLSYSLIILFQLVDYRQEFSKWWITEFKTVKFPSAGTVFDYCVDSETHKFMPWTERVPKFDHDPEMPLQVRVLFYIFLIFFFHSVT